MSCSLLQAMLSAVAFLLVLQVLLAAAQHCPPKPVCPTPTALVSLFSRVLPLSLHARSFADRRDWLRNCSDAAHRNGVFALAHLRWRVRRP